MFDLSKSIDINKFKELIVNKQIYVFDGVIGAGKTTLLKLLTKHMNNNGRKTLAIYEPVDEWRQVGALDEFYKDIPAKCLEFQTFTFITRIKRIMTQILDNPDFDYYLLERSVWTDRYIFVELLKDVMGPIRMEMYNQWWDMWSSLMLMLPQKWVLLNTSLEESIVNLYQKIDLKKKTLLVLNIKIIYIKSILNFIIN